MKSELKIISLMIHSVLSFSVLFRIVHIYALFFLFSIAIMFFIRGHIFGWIPLMIARANYFLAPTHSCGLVLTL